MLYCVVDLLLIQAQIVYCGLLTGMIQHLLEFREVAGGLIEISGEGLAQRMASHALLKARETGDLFHDVRNSSVY